MTLLWRHDEIFHGVVSNWQNTVILERTPVDSGSLSVSVRNRSGHELARIFEGQERELIFNYYQEWFRFLTACCELNLETGELELATNRPQIDYDIIVDYAYWGEPLEFAENCPSNWRKEGF